MQRRHYTAEAAHSAARSVRRSVDAAFIEAFAQRARQIARGANEPCDSVPQVPIQPVRYTSSCATRGDNGVCVKLVEPHLVFEEAKERRLTLCERIRVGHPAIHE